VIRHLALVHCPCF